MNFTENSMGEEIDLRLVKKLNTRAIELSKMRTRLSIARNLGSLENVIINLNTRKVTQIRLYFFIR